MEVDNENSLGNDESDRLTSTIGNINTTPTTDSVPSSSSDANSEVITTDKPCDDPISSTSDEVDKVNTSIITNANASDVKINPSPNTSKCGALESPKHGIEEADIFANEYNLGSTSEKITENVEDIVSDLENLLGDTSNDFSVDLIKKKDVSCDEKMQVEDQNESTREKSPVADQQSLSDDNMSRNTEVISDQKPEPTLDASPKETKDETPTVEASVDVVENEDSELSNPKITKEVLLQEDKKEVDIQAHVALIENSEKSQPTQVENEDIVPLEASQIEKCAVGAKLNETEVVGNKHNIAANESDNQEIKSPGEDNLSEATKCEEMEITPTLETAIIEPSFSQPQSEPKTGAEEKHILVEEKQMVAQEPCNIAEVQEIVVGESEKDKVNPQIIAKEPEIETDEICNVAEKQKTSEKESEMLSVEEKAETNEPEIIAEVSQADEHTSESQLQNESVKESFEAVKVSEHVLQEAQQAAEESQTLADRKSEPMDEPSDVTEEPMEIDDEVAPKSSKPVTTIYESHEDPPLVDHEAELVKAALEASSASNEGNDDSKQDENTNHLVNEDDVIRAAIDCSARNDEDIIKAAQECQQRENEDQEEEIPKCTLVPDAVLKPPVTDNIERVRLEELPQKVVREYQKPLNIVVDTPALVEDVERVESTTHEEQDCKESSDEDKQEYSSKISQSQELKLTIRKTKAEESSILKIYDPKEPVPEISPSESETEPEIESPLPKLVIKQSQLSPKVMSPLKITIKQKMNTDEQPQKSSPKVIIKPIIKPEEEPLHHSPKITIKPIPKPDEHERSHSPKITIKPLIKPSNESCVSPKIKIKPIVKTEEEIAHDEERIVLKISKNRDVKPDESEKLGKIKLKLSMSGAHAHIVNEVGAPQEDESEAKRARLDIHELNESPTTAQKTSIEVQSPEVVPVVPPTPRKRGRPRKVPLEVRVEDEELVLLDGQQDTTPERRSTRPKRSCRGPSVRDTLGMKPRKPRERGRARGRGSRGGRGRGAKAQEALLARMQKEKPAVSKVINEAALTAQIKATFEQQYQQQQQEMLKCVASDEEMVPIKLEALGDQEERLASVGEEDKPEVVVVLYEEETRMSADSRAQTPAKQIILNPIVGDAVVEESQSSVQSSATTESVKVKKCKMEIDPEGAVISADQLAEYYWGGGGPYMLQEQVAQYLGIKSFKRKYPGIARRPVDMQERDFIRESGLASEHMCDLGLTAVNSADILDLMYSDFQPKYEEYCKHQRDRQTKDITNKQRALSLAASQEKNKLDIVQQAVESAAQWNAGFNKARREERKACMDLQTFTINYPKGRMKSASRPKIGDYPIALVPGQYTDYYKTYTPTELNNLPLNTMLYRPINIVHEEDSQSDGSGSESDTSSSGSDSSDSETSEDDCNVCSPPQVTSKRIYT